MKLIPLTRDLDNWNKLYYAGTKKEPQEIRELWGVCFEFPGPDPTPPKELERKIKDYYLPRLERMAEEQRLTEEMENPMIGYNSWAEHYEGDSGKNQVPVSFFVVSPRDYQLEFEFEENPGHSKIPQHYSMQLGLDFGEILPYQSPDENYEPDKKAV